MAVQSVEPLVKAAEQLAAQVRNASGMNPQQQLFVLGAALDTLQSALPPMLWWWQAMGSSLLFVPVQAAFEAGLFQHVPQDDSSISAAELSARAGLDEDRVARAMRFLATNGVFVERGERQFAHSPLSAAVANSAAGLTPAIEWAFTDFQNAGTALRGAMEGPDLDCWTKRFGVPLFRYLEQDEHEAARTRYGRAVAQHTISETDEINEIVPWGDFSLVVDVGAGNGQVGAHLTKHHNHLRVINQDMENVISDRVKELKSAPLDEQAVFDKVEFEAHDYYAPQTRTDANAFLLRFVLHNNNDSNCVKILQALVLGLAANENGEAARLLIAERVMPEWDTDKRPQLRQQRIEDMAMLVSCSGKQRTVEELSTLLKKADPRYEVDQIYRGKDVFQVMSVKYASD